MRKSNFLTTGLALFSMFFGAGNLVFPLLIGKAVGSNIWAAIAGLSITAVIVPFLGLGAMILFQGDFQRFFGRLGKIPGTLLLLLLQLILGPLGVIPRLITLMQATAAPYLGNLSLFTFSILVAIAIFGCSLKKQRLIRFLGAILTPFLLLSLATLIFFGVLDSSSPNPVSISVGNSFFHGLIEGYNTMDLIAAFLFASVILPHFQEQTSKKQVVKKMLFSSGIAAFLLFLTYVGLCLISAYHGWTLVCPPEQLLSRIATKLLGPVGGGIAALAIFLACFTTAITLVSIFADYLRKDLCKQKIGYSFSLALTLLMAILFASIGFSGIISFLSPILQIIYPGLILLTVLNLFYSLSRSFKKEIG